MPERPKQLGLILLVCWLGALSLRPIYAIDRDVRIDQLHNSVWTFESAGIAQVRQIVQTPDGFLWLVTSDNRLLDRWTAFFLVTTTLTSATGYLFPFYELLPSHIVGAISLLILPLAIFARYVRQLAGSWRRTYVIAAMIAFYLNVFVLIVQGFRKIPALKEIAPTGTEAPFKLAQLPVLAVFVLLTVLADKRFRPATTGLHTSVAYLSRDGAD